jgi:20S proteasome subunit beta 4
MEALFGIVGKDFCMVAADVVAANSILVLKSTEDKSRDLNKHITMLYTGEKGDTVNFAEYVQRNVQLYGIRNEIPMSTKGAANYTRRELSDALRSKVRWSGVSL